MATAPASFAESISAYHDERWRDMNKALRQVGKKADEVSVHRARVEIMTAPGRVFEGEVESLGWGVTALPQDPFAGLPIVMKELDWVRLSQRFPVTIRLDKNIPADLLRVGASATATILPARR